MPSLTDSFTRRKFSKKVSGRAHRIAQIAKFNGVACGGLEASQAIENLKPLDKFLAHRQARVVHAAILSSHGDGNSRFVG
jgi:hypothetical protein